MVSSPPTAFDFLLTNHPSRIFWIRVYGLSHRTNQLVAHLHSHVDLSRLKALGQPQEALPKDVGFPLHGSTPSTTHRPRNILQIAIETLIGAILGIIGASLYGPPLKQISWASEMRQQYASILSIFLFHKLSHNGVAKSTKWMPG